MDIIPTPSYHFRVDFESSSFNRDNDFTSVSGIDARLVFENELAEKPSGAVFGDIVLRRPLKLRSKLTFSVLHTINSKRLTLLDFKISLLDSKHEEIITWFIAQAQPVRYALDEFNATKSAIAIETFAFRCKSITHTPPRT